MGEGEGFNSGEPVCDGNNPRHEFRGHRWGHMWGSRREQRIWHDIEKGIERDVAQMRREGMSSEEYWKKVWTDIHKDGYKGPEIFNNPDLKERWEKIQSEGRIAEDVWNNKYSEEAVSFMWVPMMKRWRNIGAGETSEEFRKHMMEAVEKRHVGSLSPELKTEYEKMKGENKQAEFWRSHWDELHKSGGHRGPWCWVRRRKAQFEDEPIYKEFDFC